MAITTADYQSVMSSGWWITQTVGGTTGDISVAVTPDSATWNLKGPVGFTEVDDTGDQTYSTQPTGVYLLTPNAVAGYDTPSATYGELTDGGTLTLTLTYTTTAASVSKALVNKLKADATLQGLMTTYNSEYTWFSLPSAPEGADRPLGLVIPVSDTPWNTTAAEGREQTWDIACFIDADGSIATLESIAEQVHDLFDSTQSPTLSVSGYTTDMIDVVSGPTIAPTDDTLYGRVVTIRLRLTKE